MIACLNSDERIGACGPRLLNTDGSLQHSVWRNPPTAWEIIVNGVGLWRLIPRSLRGSLLLGGHWDHATRRSVPMLFGAAILARRKMIDEVGGLDERFHMYGEDYEWCCASSCRLGVDLRTGSFSDASRRPVFSATLDDSGEVARANERRFPIQPLLLVSQPECRQPDGYQCGFVFAKELVPTSWSPG